MAERPSGTVTFLFMDMEGSTKRWEQYPQQMGAALARHDEILRSAIEEQGGYVFKTVGDDFCAAFSSPYPALQAALSREKWPRRPVRCGCEWPYTGAVDEQAVTTSANL